jgi:hypothetical protein
MSEAVVKFERKRVTISNGRYYYIQDLEERRPSGKPKQKWHPLTRVDAGEKAMLEAHDELLGSAQADATAGNFGTATAAFKKVKLPELTYEVKKEYGRMLDIATVAFRDFDVVDVTPGDAELLNENFAPHPTARRSYKARLSTFFSWCVLERPVHNESVPRDQAEGAAEAQAPDERRGVLGDARPPAADRPVLPRAVLPHHRAPDRDPLARGEPD